MTHRGAEHVCNNTSRAVLFAPETDTHVFACVSFTYSLSQSGENLVCTYKPHVCVEQVVIKSTSGISVHGELASVMLSPLSQCGNKKTRQEKWSSQLKCGFIKVWLLLGGGMNSVFVLYNCDLVVFWFYYWPVYVYLLFAVVFLNPITDMITPH